MKEVAIPTNTKCQKKRIVSKNLTYSKKMWIDILEQGQIESHCEILFRSSHIYINENIIIKYRVINEYYDWFTPLFRVQMWKHIWAELYWIVAKSGKPTDRIRKDETNYVSSFHISCVLLSIFLLKIR